MTLTASIRSPRLFATGPGALSAALLFRLARGLADARRRRADRRIEMVLEQLGHPELIADFHRATRDRSSW